MTVPTTHRRVARGAAVLAAVAGLVGVLSLMGAFGPVTCATESASGSGAASDDGTATAGSTDRVETPHGCVSGIDYLLGDTGGNAAALFFWPLVLAALVALGGAAAWTGRRRLTWVAAGAGAVVSVAGFMSIGWYFALPTLALVVAATALTVERRRGARGETSSE